LLSGAGRLAAQAGGFGEVLDAATTAPYGGLMIAKTVVFALLIVGGWIHRGQIVTNLIEPGPSFWQLVAVELLIMAAALGLSVALSQTT
jgi:putative copper export protein